MISKIQKIHTQMIRIQIEYIPLIRGRRAKHG